MSTVEKRTLSGSFYGFIQLILSFIQSILLVPLLISNWGAGKYGIYLNIFAFIQILRTLDLGHQTYVGNEFNRNYHRNRQQATLVLTSSIRMSFVLGFLELLVFIGIWISGKAHSLLGIEPEQVNLIMTGILGLVIMWWLIGSVSGVFAKAVLSKGLFAQAVLWAILLKVLEIAMLIVAGIYDMNLFHLLCLWSITYFIFSIFALRWMWNQLGGVGIHWKLGSWKEAIENLKSSTVLTINNMFEQFSTNGINFLVTRYISLVALPIYSTLRTATNMAVQMTNLIMNPLQPELIRYHSQRAGEKISSVSKAYWIIGGSIVNISLLGMVPFMAGLYATWTNHKLEFHPVLFFLLCMSVAIANFGKTWTSYLHGINDLKAITIMSVSRFGILFTIVYFGNGQYGLAAVGWGVLNAELVSSLLLPYFLTKIKLKELNSSLDMKAVFLAIQPVFILALCYILMTLTQLNIWLVSSLGIILMIFFYFLMWTKLELEVQHRLKSIIQNQYSKLKRAS